MKRCGREETGWWWNCRILTWFSIHRKFWWASIRRDLLRWPTSWWRSSCWYACNEEKMHSRNIFRWIRYPSYNPCPPNNDCAKNLIDSLRLLPVTGGSLCHQGNCQRNKSIKAPVRATVSVLRADSDQCLVVGGFHVRPRLHSGGLNEAEDSLHAGLLVLRERKFNADQPTFKRSLSLCKKNRIILSEDMAPMLGSVTQNLRKRSSGKPFQTY